MADIRVAWLVYIYTYCVPIATLNQNKRSRLLYLGDMQTIINVLACGLVFSHLIGFFLQHNNSPEMFLAFPVFLVPLYIILRKAKGAQISAFYDKNALKIGVSLAWRLYKK